MRGRRRAAVFAETAFALPVLLLVTLSLIQLGVVAWGANAATNAARHGARMASVVQGGGAAGVARAMAAQAIASEYPIGEASVQVLSPGGAPGSVLTVRVTVRAPNLLAPLLGLFGLPSAWTVSGEASFRQEGW